MTDHQWHFYTAENNVLKTAVINRGQIEPAARIDFTQEKEITQVTMSSFKRQRQTFTIDQITEQFENPIAHAAKSLGISVTRLKQICRGYGFTQWPFRKLTHLKKKIVKLEKKREEAVRMNWSREALMKLDQLIHIEYDEIGRLITPPARNPVPQQQQPQVPQPQPPQQTLPAQEEDQHGNTNNFPNALLRLLKSNKRKKASKDQDENGKAEPQFEQPTTVTFLVKRNKRKLSPRSHGEWLSANSSPSSSPIVGPSNVNPKKRVKRLKISNSSNQEFVTKYSDSSSNSEKEDEEILPNASQQTNAAQNNNTLAQERKKQSGKSSLNLFHFFKGSNKVTGEIPAPQININAPQQPSQQKSAFSLQNLFGQKKSNNQQEFVSPTAQQQPAQQQPKKGIFSFFGLSGKEKNVEGINNIMQAGPSNAKMNKFNMKADDLSSCTQSCGTELPSFSELLASIQEWSENTFDCDPTEGESESIDELNMMNMQDTSESSEFTLESCLSGGSGREDSSLSSKKNNNKFSFISGYNASNRLSQATHMGKQSFMNSQISNYNFNFNNHNKNSSVYNFNNIYSNNNLNNPNYNASNVQQTQTNVMPNIQSQEDMSVQSSADSPQSIMTESESIITVNENTNSNMNLNLNVYNNYHEYNDNHATITDYGVGTSNIETILGIASDQI